MADKSFMALIRAGRFVNYFDRRLFVPHGHFAETYLIDGHKYETHVLAMFDRFVHPGDTVLDIGANIGTHTLALSSLVGPSGIVYAVEADLENASMLQSSIEESAIQNVRVLAVAASNTPGIIAASVSSMTNHVFSSTPSANTLRVAATVVLDTLIDDKIAFIKIDIEGAELLALQGLSRTIERGRPVVLSEFSPAYITGAIGRDRSEDFANFFVERRYDCFRVDHGGVLHQIANGHPALIEAFEAAFDLQTCTHLDLVYVPAETPLAERSLST